MFGWSFLWTLHNTVASKSTLIPTTMITLIFRPVSNITSYNSVIAHKLQIYIFFKLPCQLSRKRLSGYPQIVDLDSKPSQALQCSYMHDRALQCKHSHYSAVLSKSGRGQHYMCACMTGIPRFSCSAWA